MIRRIPNSPLAHPENCCGEIRNLNAVHYTKLRSVEHMRQAYRAVQRNVFDLDIILDNSVKYRLDEIDRVFARETRDLDAQDSLKTIILP